MWGFINSKYLMRFWPLLMMFLYCGSSFTREVIVIYGTWKGEFNPIFWPLLLFFLYRGTSSTTTVFGVDSSLQSSEWDSSGVGSRSTLILNFDTNFGFNTANKFLLLGLDTGAVKLGDALKILLLDGFLFPTIAKSDSNLFSIYF